MNSCFTFTEMGEILRSLASYENIKLHPNCHEVDVQEND